MTPPRIALPGSTTHDAVLTTQPHRRAAGARSEARCERSTGSDVAAPFGAPATGRRRRHGPVACRRGIVAAAALPRVRCANPAPFEAFGPDIFRAGIAVVRSRGHVRHGLDEFFGFNQVAAVDAPGLTTPMLVHFAEQQLPRPVVPPRADNLRTPAP